VLLLGFIRVGEFGKFQSSPDPKVGCYIWLRQMN